MKALMEQMAVAGYGVSEEDEYEGAEEEVTMKEESVETQFDVACNLLDGIGVKQDTAKATKIFVKLAELAHPGAQYNLGRGYDNGIGVAKDEKKAVEWYTRAAEKGYSTAQSNLGYCYENGKGVAKDKNKAREWYLKSSQQGYSNAQTRLNSMG